MYSSVFRIFSLGLSTRTTTSFRSVIMALLMLGSLGGGQTLAQESGVEPIPSHQVDINTADADELALALDGVGRTRAEAIVAWREENGRFERVEDLQEVSGIGPATLERNRERLRVDPADD